MFNHCENRFIILNKMYLSVLLLINFTNIFETSLLSGIVLSLKTEEKKIALVPTCQQIGEADIKQTSLILCDSMWQIWEQVFLYVCIPGSSEDEDRAGTSWRALYIVLKSLYFTRK